MPFSEKLADRIREFLVDVPNIEETLMFGGVCFMLNGKMCIGVIKNEMLCRIDPALNDEELEKTACRPLDFTGKSMKGFIFVGEEALKSKRDFVYWINLCLDYNPRAKASKRKKK